MLKQSIARKNKILSQFINFLEAHSFLLQVYLLLSKWLKLLLAYLHSIAVHSASMHLDKYKATFTRLNKLVAISVACKTHI